MTGSVLGSDHPITLAEVALRDTRDAAIVCGAIAMPSAVVAASLGEPAAVLAASAVLVGAISALMHGGYRVRRRALVHEEIRAGRAWPALPAFTEEAARLRSRGRREGLRQVLRRSLHDAEHWEALTVASRPPAGVRRLAEHRDLVEAAIDALGAPTAPSLRALVLLERLVHGGYGSALHVSADDWVSSELVRIHYELTSGADVARAPRRLTLPDHLDVDEDDVTAGRAG